MVVGCILLVALATAVDLGIAIVTFIKTSARLTSVAVTCNDPACCQQAAVVELTRVIC